MNERYPRPTSKTPGASPNGLNGHADHTPDPFDALTDLFLGDGDQLEASINGGQPEVKVPSASGSRAGQTLLRLTSGDDDDDGRELFPASTPAASEPQIVRGIECLLLGHLPVFASAWVSQYIRETSLGRGSPVALLRLQSGYATVELVGDQSAPTPDNDRDQPGTLEQALRAASRRASLWIVRTDAAEEQEVAGHRIVDRITLLTGADEAAVVGAYRCIKGLSQRLASPRNGLKQDQAAELPNLRVAVIGAAADAAKEVGSKLADASLQFLGRGLECIPSSPMIQASRSSVLLFSGRAGMTTPAILDRLERIISEPSRPLTMNQAAPPLIRPQAPPPPRPEPRAAVKAAPLPSPIVQLLTPAKSAAAAAAITPTPAPPAPGALALHVASLKPVSARCPFAPGVEFAVDQTGAPHLLVHANDDQGDEDVLSWLLIASAWTESHAQILSDALGRSIGGGYRAAAPVMHLFTDKPRQSRRLLDTGVRMHLLANVRAGEQTVWYCTELN